jgi:hypothetical protein
MVRFEEDKLVIELKAYGKKDAIDRWLSIHDALYDLMEVINDDTLCDTFFAIPGLLKELSPDWDTLTKMAE